MLEPIGGLRGDWQAASVCAMLANLEAARRGAKHVFEPSDFLLEFKEKSDEPRVERPTPAPPRQSWQEMKMIGMAWAAASQAPRKRGRR